MQLDAFFMELIQVSLFDGIAIGLGSAFIVTCFCALLLTRKMSISITWSVAAIATILIGTLSGFLVMNSIGFFAVWSGSAIHGLSGDDLISWTSTIASTFNSYQIQVISLSYLGSLAGLAMGYGIGIPQKYKFTISGTIFSILGVSALLIGFTLIMLPTVLNLDVILLYVIIGLLSLLFLLFWLKYQRMKTDEDLEYHVTPTDSTI
ncbi:hypothetical protein EU527_08060 [Candidatus Thorarchaeota archaeon]|nr:MAG: hypothetical protein EU527_08060 [Candidatus Thorarchaeota archaeon]